MNKKIKILIRSLIIAFLIYALYLVIYRIRAYPYDELWNYNNIYKMFNGYRIYESTNVIITPLFYYIGLVWMKLFGSSVISIRYLGIAIFGLMYFIIYKLLKKLDISKPSIVVGISLLLIRSFQIVTNSANYNFLSLTFFYLGFLIIISKNFKFKDYVLGIVYFLILMSKQNMALYFIIVTLIYDFYKRENIKSFLIQELKRIITFAILTILFIGIYYKTSLLKPFINYAFMGISSFRTSNFKFNSDIFYPILYLVVIILDIFIIFNKKSVLTKPFIDEKRDNIIALFLYSLFSLLIIYPILNNAHFLMAAPLFFINLIYIFDVMMLKDFFDNEKSLDYSLLLVLIIIISISARLLYAVYVDESDSIKYENPNTAFNNLYFGPRDYEVVTKVSNYIKDQEKLGKKVVILSFDACLANIPLKINNGDLDLIFEGNLGKEGSSGVINKIKNLKNTKFLILTDEEERFWQESPEVFEYIKNNYNKTGEILNYTIYE